MKWRVKRETNSSGYIMQKEVCLQLKANFNSHNIPEVVWSADFEVVPGCVVVVVTCLIVLGSEDVTGPVLVRVVVAAVVVVVVCTPVVT